MLKKSINKILIITFLAVAFITTANAQQIGDPFSKNEINALIAKGNLLDKNSFEVAKKRDLYT